MKYLRGALGALFAAALAGYAWGAFADWLDDRRDFERLQGFALKGYKKGLDRRRKGGQ